MRYLMTLNGGGPVPDQQLFADMAVFVEELTRAGVLLATGGLEPLGTHISASGGQATMIFSGLSGYCAWLDSPVEIRATNAASVRNRTFHATTDSLASCALP